MIFAPNLVIGLGIMMFGSALLLDRLGVVEASALFAYWPVLLMLYGASVITQSFRRDAPTAPVERPLIAPGFVLFVLVAAMVASYRVYGRADGQPSTGAEPVRMLAVLSGTTRGGVLTNFREAEMTSLLGNTTLDLREASVAPGEVAIVDVLGMMGKATIVVPPGWQVDVKAVPVMGGVRDLRIAPTALDPAVAGATVPPPRVEVRGFIMMGRIHVRSDPEPRTSRDRRGD